MAKLENQNIITYERDHFEAALTPVPQISLFFSNKMVSHCQTKHKHKNVHHSVVYINVLQYNTNKLLNIVNMTLTTAELVLVSTLVFSQVYLFFICIQLLGLQ